jgi:hypothetical protein
MPITIEQFTAKLIRLNTDYPGMGGASSAIMGAHGTHSDIISNLHAQIAAFAGEYVKKSPDQQRLTRLQGEIEGSLRALQLISAISEDSLDALLTELHELQQARSTD